jgi:hypothetical protein
MGACAAPSPRLCSPSHWWSPPRSYPPPAHAQGADDTTTTSAVPTRDIIPQPNVGAEPDDAGDRGGGLQTALFIGIIVVVAGAGTFLVRQSRQAREGRGF